MNSLGIMNPTCAIDMVSSKSVSELLRVTTGQIIVTGLVGTAILRECQVCIHELIFTTHQSGDRCGLCRDKFSAETSTRHRQDCRSAQRPTLHPLRDPDRAAELEVLQGRTLCRADATGLTANRQDKFGRIDLDEFRGDR